MERSRVPLSWRLAALPVVVAVVTGGAAFLALRHTVIDPEVVRAQQRVDQAAVLMADQMARVVTRRLSEMELLIRATPNALDGSTGQQRTALQALLRASRGYLWIAVVDDDGQVLVTGQGEGGPARIANWPAFGPASAPSALRSPVEAFTAAAPLADLRVRIEPAPGQPVRWLVAQLSRAHAQDLLDLVLGPPPARRTLDVQVLDAAGQVLAGPPAPAATASSKDTDFRAEAPVANLPGTRAAGWRVVATQQRAAALAPAREAQRQVLLSLAAIVGALGLVGWGVSRHLTRPYEGLLEAIARRLRVAPAVGSAKFTQALDALAEELKAGPVPADDPLRAVLRDAQRLRTLIDGLPLATVVTDVGGRIKLWTRGAEALFGHRSADVLGRELRDVLRGDLHLARSAELLRQLAEDPAGVPPTRAKVQRADGEPVWIEWVGMRLNGTAGAPVDLLLQARDLTAERLARARSRQSARRLDIVLAAARDTSFLLMDSDARVLEWSRGTELMGGWPEGTLAGQPHDRFFTPEDVARGVPQQLRDEARQHGRAVFEGWRVRRDGSRFWGEVTLYPMPGADPDRPAGFVQVVRDLTDRHETEIALQQARLDLSALARHLMEQEKATTQRVAQALHDRLGQILAALRFHAEALNALPPDRLWAEARVRGPAIDRLHAEAIREVRQVLTDLRPPLLDELGLVAALENELRTRTAGGAGIELTLDADASTRSTRWPAAVEYAAFMIAREAVANAVQHSGSPRVRVVVGGDAERLDLRVQDDGTGLPAGNLARPGHLGVVGMRERALAINATLSLGPAAGRPPHGTEVRLAWPATAVEPPTTRVRIEAGAR